MSGGLDASHRETADRSGRARCVVALDAAGARHSSGRQRGDYREAFAEIASLQPAVAQFFDDVLVMADDEALRTARLALVATLRDLILDIADISEIVTES